MNKIANQMRLEQFYKKHEHAYVVYWFATGKRPSMSLMIAGTFSRHKDVIVENVMSRNRILSKLKGNIQSKPITEELSYGNHL